MSVYDKENKKLNIIALSLNSTDYQKNSNNIINNNNGMEFSN